MRCSEKVSSTGDGEFELTPYGSCGRSLYDQVEMGRAQTNDSWAGRVCLFELKYVMNNEQ